MALRRPQTQQLQKESIIAVETVVNEMNCEFRRLEPDNAGIDGEIDLVRDSAFEGKVLKTQIKAGRSYISSEKQDHVRVKVERKYVELWNVMNVPVVLLFYHPASKALYWKSVQDYLKCDPNVLKKGTKSVIFPFDKTRDLFTVDVISSLRQVVEGDFKYDKIIYTEDSQEEVLSNWFPVISLPQTIYIAPTPYRDHRDITNQLTNYYTFILKEQKIYTFSNLNNSDCELRDFCDYSDDVLEVKSADEIPENFYMELLNRMLFISALQYQMYARDEKFYFSARVLANEASTRFEYKPLKSEKETSRFKIYISKTGDVIEYKHMAVRLSFIKLGSDWYFQIEPDWHFSYPGNNTKTRRDIGIRVTKEKAGMFNVHYLYLLHSWKQFLSNSSDKMVFRSDDLPDFQVAEISTINETFISNFMLFNDYIGPRID